MSESDMPLISVATVVFNGAQYIEETLKSVVTQTYPNIEYLVIDGGSTDGTVDIIRKHQSSIDYWISEPDGGIYDAMNKAVSASKGEWIIFMNAGDSFSSESTVKEVFSKYPENADMIYGGHQIKYDNGYLRLHKPGKLESIWKGLPFSHQSLFTKTALMKRFPFNKENRLGADFEFIYKAYIKGCRITEVNLVVATTQARGVSDTERKQAIKTLWRVSTSVSNRFGVHAYFAYLIIDCLFRRAVKSILPKKVTAYFVKRK